MSRGNNGGRSQRHEEVGRRRKGIIVKARRGAVWEVCTLHSATPNKRLLSGEREENKGRCANVDARWTMQEQRRREGQSPRASENDVRGVTHEECHRRAPRAPSPPLSCVGKSSTRTMQFLGKPASAQACAWKPWNWCLMEARSVSRETDSVSYSFSLHVPPMDASGKKRSQRTHQGRRGREMEMNHPVGLSIWMHATACAGGATPRGRHAPD